MESKNKVWEIVEYSLGLVALVGLFLFVLLNMSLELHDPDIWLHLKTGEYIVQQKAIPQADIFSSVLSGKEWINHSWLTQVIFYLVYHFGGSDNLIFFSALIMVIAFLFLFFSVYKERKDLFFCVAILVISIFASKMRFNIRPENFSLLFFSLYIFILNRHPHKKLVFLLPFLQLLWVNCHGFFILGPLLLSIFILGNKLKGAARLPWEWKHVEVWDKATYKRVLIVFWLVLLACFLNPYGYKGALYPFLIIFNSAGKFGIFYNHIQELLPTWRLGHNYVLPYYTLAAGSFLVFLLNFKRINLSHLLAWLVFLAISLSVNRNVVFFNFIAFVTASDGLIKKFSAKKHFSFEDLFAKAIYVFKYIIIIVVIIVAVKKCSGLLNIRYYIFEENSFKSALLGVATKEYPGKAADFTLKNDLPENIFNLFNYGSYLAYRFFPRKKVFLDGRTELYGGDFFNAYEKALYVDKYTIEVLLKKYKVNTVFLAGDLWGRIDLTVYFFNNPGWSLVYLDEDSTIFLKNTAQNKALIDKLKVDLKKWQILKADLDKIGLKRVYPEPYIKFAWMFYSFGFDDLAIAQAKEALRILPSSSDAYNILGRVYTKQKLYPRAFEALRLANIYEPSYKETLISLGKFYLETDKTDKAIKIYKKMVKLNPYSADGYYLLGQAYHQLGDLKSALKAMRTALKITPFSAEYYKELGRLLCKNKNAAGAREIYQKAIAFGLDPEGFHKLIVNLQK